MLTVLLVTTKCIFMINFYLRIWFSGPAILQISSYWKAGETITINLLPEFDVLEMLLSAKKSQPQKQLKHFD